ncbi:TetR-like C-terminal domain-containing protein [Streptomyces sp. NPDC049837]|uniref:TetR-like C-terminal domain-containing protein n=1 Tax=Streptomyces sp. NPDC049837 TaxID=3155277 RepID=UPI003428CDF1
MATLDVTAGAGGGGAGWDVAAATAVAGPEVTAATVATGPEVTTGAGWDATAGGAGARADVTAATGPEGTAATVATGPEATTGTAALDGAFTVTATAAATARTAALAAPAPAPRGEDLRADLARLLRALAQTMNDPRFQGPARALASAGIDDADLARQFTRRVLEPCLAPLAERLRAASERGEVAAGRDPAVALDVLIGPVVHRWLLLARPVTPEFTDLLADLLVTGLAPRTGAA